MAKKLLALVLSILTVVTVFAGCGAKGEGSGAAGGDGTGKDVNIAIVFGLGGLGDKSFNDNANEGATKAKDEFGINYQYVEPKEIAEFEGHHRDFAKEGKYNLIIGIGFDQADAINTVAAEFPDQKFLLIDGEAAEAPNVASVTFKDNEKAYLIGIIAGMTTKTNKIGMVGGMDIPLINAFAAGYKAGAQSANKDIEVMIKYVGAWNDANTAKELALSMYDAGADIVYQTAGGSGLGVFSAAADKDALAIGADVNQIPLDPAHIFLSSVRRVDNVVYNEIKAIIDGTFEAGNFVQGFKEGAVSYTVEGAEKETSKEAIEAADKAKQDIIDGKIEVPSTLD